MQLFPFNWIWTNFVFLFSISTRYNDKLELEDAVHAAILTLKESFEGQMTENNIEIAVCNEKGFRVLQPSEIKDYLATIP